MLETYGTLLQAHILKRKTHFTSNFTNKLGMGAGIGLRADVQGFVIRFDLAAPFHDPA
jgi:outer membrane protein insertion porin family